MVISIARRFDRQTGISLSALPGSIHFSCSRIFLPMKAILLLAYLFLFRQPSHTLEVYISTPLNSYFLVVVKWCLQRDCGGAIYIRQLNALLLR